MEPLVVAAAVACCAVASLTALHLWRRGGEPVPEDEWRRRPVLGALVQLVAMAVPIGAAVLASTVLSRRMAEPDGLVETARNWAALLGASTVTLLLVDRLARRLLPLAALLRLSMAFPSEAPQRLGVARRAGSIRDLERRVAHTRSHGAGATPGEAAKEILALSAALSSHDRRTRGHCERVRTYTDLIAEELKLPKADKDRLRWAAMLHDVGKLEVPASILNKAGKPTPDEWAHLHRHPEAGHRMTRGLHEWLGPWAATIEQHHERWDGRGYPHGLAGEDIALGARIVAVADAYEVMTAARTYKKPMSAIVARAELTQHAGGQFDPTVVRAFLSVAISRQRWVMGPLAWLSQVPFVGWVPRFAEGAAAVAGPAVGFAGTVAGAAVISAGATMGLDGGTVPGTERAPAPPPVVAPAQPERAPTTTPTTVVGTSADAAPPVSTVDAAPAGTTATTSTVPRPGKSEAKTADAPGKPEPETKASSRKDDPSPVEPRDPVRDKSDRTVPTLPAAKSAG